MPIEIKELHIKAEIQSRNNAQTVAVVPDAAALEKLKKELKRELLQELRQEMRQNNIER